MATFQFDENIIDKINIMSENAKKCMENIKNSSAGGQSSMSMPIGENMISEDECTEQIDFIKNNFDELKDNIYEKIKDQGLDPADFL